MASEQIERVRNHWQAQAEAREQPSLEEMRLYDDYWAALTGEPADTDYIQETVGGVPGLWAVPKDAPDHAAIIAFHGGGFITGSPYSHRKMYGHIAEASGTRVFIPRYRLAPEHGFPSQLEDAEAVYRELLSRLGSADRLLIAGDSAGGGLALALLVKLRDGGVALPSGAMVLSAWTDMELGGASYETNAAKDPVFRREMVDQLVHMVMGPEPDRRNPYASPLHADLSGLPPVYLQAGGDEGIVDDSIEFARRAQQAGVDATLDVFPEMLHSFQMAAGRAPEADDAVARLGAWAHGRLRNV